MPSSFRTIELSDPVFESQNLRFLTVKTSNLKGRGDICLYVPQVDENLDDLPIYILLHGVYGSAWIWAMKGGAHKTTERLINNKTIKPAIIAMPSDGLWGDGSAYFAHHQKNFDNWIVNDVITAVKENIPEAKNSISTCIGGLSMGGYGALSLGGRFPEKFKAISGHSSITKLEQMTLFVEEPLEAYQQEAKFTDVIDILKENKLKLPPFRFDCGVSDDLFEANKLLHNQLLKANIPHEYEEFNGGHEWPYWIEHLEKTLIFFNQNS
ncbi:acetyl esterase [Polaribacter reichenbachii]|uniref:Acetyl esterase n=1 Tax=Polaribacter reichenbachii TaxID=996801 RepID=A0A1B8TV12_9FLAO|nr:alpha/beta hydrolase-fold protein [Polaribacter reichenbachii]APZ45583.1 acetyl esterase [Polaribacter reichenbachii]AUC19445.1 acetyl esterase [Polaribacter reichenbachii]OBY63400.1 acetyl esterase [Polaribacter reichenbachii]